MLLQRPFVLHSRHTARVLVLTPDGCPAAVLICSPALQPDHVERAVARTRQAKEVLGPELGKPVLQPLTAGRHEGLSYALWPYRFPLSDRRGLWRLQRYWLRPHLFRWLRQTTRRTLQTPSSSGMENDFAVPLQALVDGREVNARIREQAKEVLERLRAGTWKPVHVFEHNDLWKGNILLNAPMPRCLCRGRRTVCSASLTGGVRRQTATVFTTWSGWHSLCKRRAGNWLTRWRPTAAFWAAVLPMSAAISWPV